MLTLLLFFLLVCLLAWALFVFVLVFVVLVLVVVLVVGLTCVEVGLTGLLFFCFGIFKLKFGL